MFGPNEIAKLQIVKETEKAYGFKAWGNYNGSEKSWQMVVWCPKSIIKNGIIPDWFMNKKRDDYAIEDIMVVLEMA